MDPTTAMLSILFFTSGVGVGCMLKVLLTELSIQIGIHRFYLEVFWVVFTACQCWNFYYEETKYRNVIPFS
jgi:hypothetical protein